MFLAPAKPFSKVSASFNVKTVPSTDLEDAPTFSEHWLFWVAPILGAVIAGMTYRALWGDGQRH